MPKETRQSNSIRFFQVNSNNDIKRVLKNVAAEQRVRVVILSFEDEISFSNQNHYDEQILEKLKNFSIPIILTIKQIASGFTTEIVSASHLCIASDSAIFKLKDIEKLKLQIGSKNQNKINLNKKILTAEKALDLGFINKAVASKNLESEAFDWAEKIAELAPLAIESCIKAVNQGLAMNLKDGLKLETELFTKIFATKDMKEGTNAFLEKRKPSFQGK